MTYHEPEQIQAIVNRIVRQIRGQQEIKERSDFEGMVIDAIRASHPEVWQDLQGTATYPEGFLRGCVYLALDGSEEADRQQQEVEKRVKSPTAHEDKVWGYVRQIPQGEVRTCTEVGFALKIGNKQVGRTLKGCPDTVPWWRVVLKEGHLGVAGNRGIDQMNRLKDEGVTFDIQVRASHLGRR